MPILDYKSSGVDVAKGDLFVEKIKKLVPQTFDQNVMEGIGGFAAVYKMSEDRFLAASTDGVGTKLKLAQELDIHHTVGIDLVAMCVNDLLCTGARPLFFLDYMAFGKLNLKVSEELICGMVQGCKESHMALIGGETAEMPGMYQEDEYDLAGFSVGELTSDTMFSEKNFTEGDVLIGIASSGFHSNGYSFLRKLVSKEEVELKKELLTPTRIYVGLFEGLRKTFPQQILAAAHITGGGVDNIERMGESFHFHIESWPTLNQVAPIFSKIAKRTEIPYEELLKTFNMGIGLVLLVKRESAERILSHLHDHQEKAWRIGYITKK